MDPKLREAYDDSLRRHAEKRAGTDELSLLRKTTAEQTAELARLRASVEKLERALEEMTMLAENRLLRAARAEAARAVLMSAMADSARRGIDRWAQRWVDRADSAAREIDLDDLVVPTLNSADAAREEW